MPDSLISFHFNPRKSGQIFKQLCKERGVSQAVLAAKTGTSYDTVGNVFSGKVQDIQFERVFKFCTALGVPLEVYMMMMLKDENIDFEDQVLLYNPQKDDVTPVSDMESTQIPSPVSDAVVAAAVAATAVPAPDAVSISDDTRIVYAREDVTAILDRFERQHARQTADLLTVNERLCRIFEMMITQGE